MTEDILVLAAPATTTTTTSPHSDVVATPAGDLNNTTQLTFQYQRRVPVWTAAVSQAQLQVVLGADIACGPVIWQAGITIEYAVLGMTQFTVTITSGQIRDDNCLYTLQDMTLGIFPISTVDKMQSVSPPELEEEFEPAFFQALPTVNTPTSPNSNAVTTPSGDPINTTRMSFQYEGRIAVWTPIVSQAQNQAVLEADITISATTWKAGLTVRYTALRSQYTVTIVSGEIIDNGALYQMDGLVLGIFPIG